MRPPIQLAGLGLLCLYFFSVNESALYLPYDGAYMRQLVKFHFEWSNPTTGLLFGPLQGIGSVSFPVNYWFSPATLLSYALNGATIDPVLVYSFTTLELFASLWMLSNAVGASRGVQMASSWLSSVLVMPFIVPPYVNSITFYPISGLIPWVVEHLAMSGLILALILRLRSASSLTELVVIALVTIIGCWSTVAFPFSIVLSAPVIVLLLAVILLSRNRSLPSVATNVALCLVAVGVAIGPMLFVLGLLLHSVPVFFNRELVYGRPDWIFISILFHGPYKLGWASSVVFVLGLMGGLFASFKAREDFRLVARVYVGYSILLLIAGVVLTFFVTSYRGPSMLYFEWFVWPLMFIYAAYFVAQIFRFATSRVFQRWSPSHRMVRAAIAAAPVSPLVPIVVGLALLHINRPNEMTALQFPPGPTSITRYLHDNIGLTPGSQWRGSVATFSGLGSGGLRTSWPDNAGRDSTLWQVMGNDHRAMGLWWYGIPTLFTYNQFLPPDYYFLMTRLFALPDDVQQRSVIVLTRPNPPLLALFGVRYLIVDEKTPDVPNASLRKFFQWRWPCGAGTQCNAAEYLRKELLYELDHPNLGDYSPTIQIVEPTASGALARMVDPSFDPRRSVVLDASIPDNLVVAERSAMYWEKAGLRINAKSAGTSLLVLPLQFTKCLDVVSKTNSLENSVPALIRVDISLTGVLFTRELDAIIRLGYGPFEHSTCRLQDYMDAKKSRLGKES